MLKFDLGNMQTGMDCFRKGQIIQDYPKLIFLENEIKIVKSEILGLSKSVYRDLDSGC